MSVALTDVAAPPDPHALTSRVVLRTTWSVGPSLTLYLLAAVAAGGLLVAWWGSASTVDLASQVMWLNVGVGFVILSGAANLSWLLAGRRAVGERRAVLTANTRQVLSSCPADLGVTPVGAPPANAAGDLVAASSSTMFHRPACDMVAGKIVQAAPRDEHLAAGRRPCGMCTP